MGRVWPRPRHGARPVNPIVRPHELHARAFLAEQVLAALGGRQRWVLATVVGAMVAWAVGMVPSTVASLMQQGATARRASPEPPLLLILVLAAGLGAAAGPMLAAFQWLSLRRAIPGKAWLWLLANAAAWALGMPVIFLGAQANELTSSAVAIAGLVALAIFIAGALVGAVHGRVLLRLAHGGS